MRWACLLLLPLAAVRAGEGLEGKITGGKAKRLVDQALPLMRQADEVYKQWVLDELDEKTLLDSLKKAVALYDEAAAKLQAALDLQYDPGVNHRVRIAAKRLQKMRFRLYFRKKPRPRPEPPATGPKPKPEPKPEPAPRPPPPVEEDDESPPAVEIRSDGPPANPVDVDLPLVAGAGEDRENADRKAIAKLLKEHFGARKPGKLLFRHRLCGGKGAFRDGSACKECSGTGRRINLFHFRKAFWGCFTPILRDAPGALDTLKAFYERAQGDVGTLGAEVKSFKVTELDYHGYWAKAHIRETNTDGKRERAITLISVGSSWYFYSPATDGELIPEGEDE